MNIQHTIFAFITFLKYIIDKYNNNNKNTLFRKRLDF